MPTWPQNLFPNPDVNYGIESANTTIRTKMEGGRTRQRNRFSQELRGIPVTWTFNDSAFLIFQSYLANILNNGTSWFSILLPMGDDGLQSYTARFKDGTFKARYDGVLHWKVSATLEVEDQPLLSGEVLELLIELGNDLDLYWSATESLHELVNETLPQLF